MCVCVCVCVSLCVCVTDGEKYIQLKSKIFVCDFLLGDIFYFLFLRYLPFCLFNSENIPFNRHNHHK